MHASVCVRSDTTYYVRGGAHMYMFVFTCVRACVRVCAHKIMSKPCSCIRVTLLISVWLEIMTVSTTERVRMRASLLHGHQRGLTSVAFEIVSMTMLIYGACTNARIITAWTSTRTD